MRTAAPAIAFALALASPSVLAAERLDVHNGADPSSLDPHRIQGVWEARVVGDLFEGLVAEDPAGRPVPGQAERWRISDDGLVYTFELREGLAWSDGEPLTAEDFAYSFERLFDPATAAAYAYLQYPIDNAEAVNAGEIGDLGAIGVRALDPGTLEIRLERPFPPFLQALAHPTAYPVPSHVIERHGEAWATPGHLVVNGPYRVVDWVPGTHLDLAANPRYRDAADVAISSVRHHTFEDAGAALRRYRAGEIDLLSDFPAAQLELIERELPGQAQVAPVAATGWLSMNQERAPFEDARVRRALALAIERRAIVEGVLGTGEPAARTVVPPGFDGFASSGPAWHDETMDARRTRARTLLAEAGFGAERPLAFALSYFDDGTVHEVVVAIRAMWAAVGVEAELVRKELNGHFAALAAGDYEVAADGWIADYEDAENFLSLFRSTNAFNYSRWRDEDYDGLLGRAAREPDARVRRDLLERAERRLLEADAVIPLYHFVSRRLVSPRVEGSEPNPLGIHRTRWLRFSD